MSAASTIGAALPEENRPEKAGQGGAGQMRPWPSRAELKPLETVQLFLDLALMRAG